MVATKRQWIDITMEFGSAAGTFPGDAPYRMHWTGKIGDGHWAVNLSKFESSPHNGTHSDAPIHVLEGGAASESLDPDAFIGPCVVIDATGTTGTALPASLVASVRSPRVLFRTRATKHGDAFPASFKGLSLELAKALAKSKVRLVGTDAPSMDAFDSKGLPAHKALFGAGSHVLENLDLSEAPPGEYELLALPMKTRGLCAAPVRALLRRRS